MAYKKEEPRKKKAFGQHFLRKQSVVDNMINAVTVEPEDTVLEIGCGDGFLTRSILEQTKCKQLACYEIDPEWAEVVRNNIRDKRLNLMLKDILDVQTEELEQLAPLVVLANLPYQITFPIFFLFQRNKHLIKEGVVMIQEEVAQKIVAKRGKPYSKTSLFLQYHFEVKLLEQIEPEAFEPAPKVTSRLIYFKPKKELQAIPHEEGFWQFVKSCFQFPRRTLHNNLKTTHYPVDKLSSELMQLRAQQLSFDDFIKVWSELNDDR